MDAVAIFSILAVVGCLIVFSYLVAKVVKLINTDSSDDSK